MLFEPSEKQRKQTQGAYWYLEMQRKRNAGIRYGEEEWKRFSKKYLKEALGPTFLGLKSRRQFALEEYLKLKRHEIYMNGDQFKELRSKDLENRLLTHPRWQGVNPRIIDAMKDIVAGGNALKRISRDYDGFTVEFKNYTKTFSHGTSEAAGLAKLFSNKTSLREQEKDSLTAKDLGLEEDIEGYILEKYGMKSKIKKIPYTAYSQGLKKKMHAIMNYKPAYATT